MTLYPFIFSSMPHKQLLACVDAIVFFFVFAASDWAPLDPRSIVSMQVRTHHQYFDCALSGLSVLSNLCTPPDDCKPP